MRIVHVTDSNAGNTGGIHRHMLNLSVAQKARGDNPTIVTTGPWDLTPAFAKHGITVVIEPRLSPPPARRGTPARGEAGKEVDELRSLLKNVAAEVVHCHFLSLAETTITAGNKVNVPCLYTEHTAKAPHIFDLDYDVITVSRNAYKELRDRGFPEERLSYVPNGTRAVPRAANKPSQPSLIWVGRLVPIKGLDLAILAMADLKQRRGRECPVLNVYGQGNLEGHLKEMVSVLRLGDVVRFHGVQQGILERCPATDILVISSVMEGGPMVALEAMSRGMPIVATRVGEIPEMIPDKRYGYIVMNHSITSLADGIESMLADVRAGRFDPSLPISRHRELFTVEKMAERVDAAYKRSISRHAS